MVVGYPGQFDVYLARLLSWLHRKPLVWDIFMSIYLIASERGLDGSSPLTVQAIRFIERIATALPDRLVIDTQDYAAWFEQIHNISASRFRLVPTGADNRYFSPQKSSADPGRKFTVLYYGTFIPNHGVSTIVEAAHQLASSTDITFELVGDGPERALAEHKVRTYGLTNVRFVDWLAPPALLEYIAQADLCLGVFGATPQSLMTVQNKIYEALAMAKPILTGDGPAIRRTLSHGEHVYFCQREDPTALAAAIQTLKSSPVLRARLAEQGYRFFLAHFTVEQLGKRFASALCEVVHLP
jgi:glycosyltransferase involved in cell wall biosynthesis